MGHRVQAAKGCHLAIPLGERFTPGPIVHRPPVSRRNTHRPDRGEQVVGNGQALRG